ncbi:MAG: type I methionyl aminopeptidase [Bacteroidota bacterium]|nr:type I methionyl aminopeptidase [Bacteroidota bacterium]MDW8271939.1 type I methionyl aminopeptidase [Bacteroidota bacterium]
MKLQTASGAMAADRSTWCVTEEQQAAIAAASRLVGATLEMLASYIQPGVETKRLDRLAEEFIRDHGGEPAFKGYGGNAHTPPFPSTLCISIDSEVVHGIPSQRCLEEGQIVSIDCGVRYDGCYGDGAWSFAVGQVSQEKQQLLAVTCEALYRGIEQARAGNTTYDIARAIQQYVEANGFTCVRELVGHGVGTALHLDPAVPNFVPGLLHRNRYPRTVLVEGMTLAIEPMVNAGSFTVYTARDGWTVCTTDGKPSAHFEHTVRVGRNGAEILTVHSLRKPTYAQTGTDQS